MSTKIKIRTYQNPDRYIPILVQEYLYLYESIETDTRILIPIPILVQECPYLYQSIIPILDYITYTYTRTRMPIPVREYQDRYKITYTYTYTCTRIPIPVQEYRHRDENTYT